MRRLWIKAICLFLALPLALACYALWWGVAYRLPRGKDITVDMRSPLQKRLGESRQLQFCAGLANNLMVFPDMPTSSGAGQNLRQPRARLVMKR